MTAHTVQVPFAHGDPTGPLRRQAHAILNPWHPADYVEDALLAISELVQNVTQDSAGDGVLIISWDDSSITGGVRDEDAGCLSAGSSPTRWISLNRGPGVAG
ncbi:hypothetical protein [Actinoplanes sp. HUAS TT8]|uniref:hypothetical protein n=1 Tax=Actinoplanes sp. HUAS TT8 TaxID=3447453 RepID=UPI003F521E31